MMEKQKKSRVWSIFLLGVLVCICLAFGFNLGVNHMAQQQMNKDRNYIPLYTHKVVLQCKELRSVAYTIPQCEYNESVNDGWWFKRLLADSSTIISVEALEWPFEDKCER